MANEVRIRVVAAADDSLRSILRPLEDAVKNSRRTNAQQTKGMADDTARATQTRVKNEEKAAAYLAQISARRIAQETRATEKAARDRVRAEESAMREIERTRSRGRDKEEREARQSTARAVREHQNATRRMATEFGGRTVGNIQQGVQHVAGGVREVTQGAGYKLDVGDAMSRNIELQRRATELSNQGVRSGKARIDPKAIEEQIKNAADSTGFGRIEAAEGVNKFTAKTGDLDLGLKLLPNLGKLAKASGSDLNDLADAAGDVSSALGEMAPDQKAKKIESVMRTIAGQGQLGAVEISDLAKQMAKVGTATTGFGGDAEKNIGFMGALTQMSRQTGGSSSAAQAATSTQALLNTFRTPARMKHFEAQGVELYDKKTGIYKDPEKIILSALSASKGDPEKWKQMFANVQGGRAVEGAAGIYRNERAKALGNGMTQEGANIAALKAVKAEFDRFSQSAISEKQIDENFALRMGNQDSKSQGFNNKFEDSMGRMSERLLPALEKAEPAILRMAESFGMAAAWAAENPGKAITAAIVMSIAKAGLETAVKTAIEQGLIGAFGGGKGGKPGVPGGGGLGTAVGAAGMTISVGYAVFKITEAIWDRKDASEDSNRKQGVDVDNLLSEAKTNPNLTDREKRAKLVEARDLAQAQVDAGYRGKEAKEGFDFGPLAHPLGGGGRLSAALSFISAGEYGTSYESQANDAAASKTLDESRAKVMDAQAQIDAMSNKMGSSMDSLPARIAAALAGVTLQANINGKVPGSTEGPD